MLTSKQIISICDELIKYPHVIALLVTGSYIYGVPNEESDLDVRMIVDNIEFEKAYWNEMIRFGIRIEAFFNTVESIEKYIEKAVQKETSPNVIHFWANGSIIFDTNHVAKKLQEKAKKLWKTGEYKEYKKKS